MSVLRSASQRNLCVSVFSVEPFVNKLSVCLLVLCRAKLDVELPQDAKNAGSLNNHIR